MKEVDIEVEVTRAFHEDAPFWEFAGLEGVREARTEWLPGIGYWLDLRASYAGIRRVAEYLSWQWPAIACAVLRAADAQTGGLGGRPPRRMTKAT